MKHWSETYGMGGPEAHASVSDASKAIATKALLTAIQACKNGTGTKEQCDMVKAMAREAVNATGRNLEDLRSLGTVTIPANPLFPFPIEVPAGDLAEAAGGAVKVYQEVGPGKALSTAARVIGWAGDHPYLALGLAGTVIGAITLGPALLQVAPLLLARRR